MRIMRSIRIAKVSSQPAHWPIHVTYSLIREMFNIGCLSDIALFKAMAYKRQPIKWGMPYKESYPNIQIGERRSATLMTWLVS